MNFPVPSVLVGIDCNHSALDYVYLGVGELVCFHILDSEIAVI